MTAGARVPDSLAKMRRESTMRRTMKDMEEMNVANGRLERKARLAHLGSATESALSPEMAALVTPKRSPSKLGMSLVAAMNQNPSNSPDSKAAGSVLPSSSPTGIVEEARSTNGPSPTLASSASRTSLTAAPAGGRPSLAPTGRPALTSVRKAMSFRNLGSTMAAGGKKGDPLGGSLHAGNRTGDPLGAGSLHSASPSKKQPKKLPPRASTMDSASNKKAEIDNIISSMVLQSAQREPNNNASMKPISGDRSNLDYLITPKRVGPKRVLSLANAKPSKYMDLDSDDKLDDDTPTNRRPSRPTAAVSSSKSPTRRTSVEPPTRRNVDHFCTPHRAVPKAAVGRSSMVVAKTKDLCDDFDDIDDLTDAIDDVSVDEGEKPRHRVSIAARKHIPRRAKSGSSLLEYPSAEASSATKAKPATGPSMPTNRSAARGPPRRARSGNLDHLCTPRRAPRQNTVGGTMIDAAAAPVMPLDRGGNANHSNKTHGAPAAIARPGCKKTGMLPRRSKSIDVDSFCTPRRATKKPGVAVGNRMSLNSADFYQLGVVNGGKKKAPPPAQHAKKPPAKTEQTEDEDDQTGPLPPIFFIKFDRDDDDDISVIPNPVLPKRRSPTQRSSSFQEQHVIQEGIEGEHHRPQTPEQRHARRASMACDGSFVSSLADSHQHPGGSRAPAPGKQRCRSASLACGGLAAMTASVAVDLEAVVPTWTCTCGHDGNLLKFCGMCGAAKTWDCADCHFANQCTFKFCGMCGAAKPGVCEESRAKQTMKAGGELADRHKEDEQHEEYHQVGEEKANPRVKKSPGRSSSNGDKTGSPTKTVKKPSKGSSTSKAPSQTRN